MITVQDIRTKFNAEQIKVLNELADAVVDAANKLAENNIFTDKGKIEHKLFTALYGTSDINEQNMINFELSMRK
jgi:hypothetical protein